MTGAASDAAARQAVAVVAALRGRGQSVATAESLTGGLVGAAITSVPGASEIYRGGLIAYATELKHQLVGVSELTLATDGPVAASTAAELAQGAARICAADWGLATTGVAGPDAQAGHRVGQVFVAVAGPGGTGEALSTDRFDLAADSEDHRRPVWVRELALAGDRAKIRQLTVSAALGLLAELLDSAAQSQG